MLAKANRVALLPDERAVVELSEIEDDARVARAMVATPPAEPPSLHAAKKALANATGLVEKQQDQLASASSAVRSLQQRRPWWQVAVGALTGANFLRTLDLRTAIALRGSAQAALAEVKRDRSDADDQLTREVRSYQKSVSQHIEYWTHAAKAAEEKAAVAPRAAELLRHLPGSVRLGVVGLCEIASKLGPWQDEQPFDADDYAAAPRAAQP